MDEERILIVDDDPDIAFALTEVLEDLGDGYAIDTAANGLEAWGKVEQHSYKLVITDLRIPEIDGLELMERIRKTRPETQLILITAFGSDEVETHARRLRAFRYLTKPFDHGDLFMAARQALAEITADQRGLFYLSSQRYTQISSLLDKLHLETNADYIVLSDFIGQTVAEAGDKSLNELNVLLMLIGCGFAASFEIAHRLQQVDAFNLHFQEGKNFDFYSSNVGDNLFITILFQKPSQKSRIGMVWFYAERTIADLLNILRIQENVSIDDLLAPDFGTILMDELDNILNGTKTKFVSEGSNPPGAGDPMQTIPIYENGEHTVLSFEEASSKDLVPPELMNLEAGENLSDIEDLGHDDEE